MCEGCPQCREAEATTRYTIKTEQPETVEFALESETCSVCGRTYLLKHVLIVLEEGTISCHAKRTMPPSGGTCRGF